MLRTASGASRLAPAAGAAGVWPSAMPPDRTAIARQPGTSLRPLEVITILLVLAEHLEDVGVGHQIVRHLDGEGFGVHLWIVEGHLDVQVSEVAAAEAFRHAQGLAAGMASSVERVLVVEACGFHDEDVALPAPDRIAQERRQLERLWE